MRRLRDGSRPRSRRSQTEHRKDSHVHRLRLPGRRRTGRPAAVADALARFPDPELPSTFVGQVRGAIADAEEAGALIARARDAHGLERSSPDTPPRWIAGWFFCSSVVSRGRSAISTTRSISSRQPVISAARPKHASSRFANRSRKACLHAPRGNYPAARELFAAAAQAAIRDRTRRCQRARAPRPDDRVCRGRRLRYGAGSWLTCAERGTSARSP